MQSLDLDKIGTCKLLIASKMTHDSFNGVMEANVPKFDKIDSDSSKEDRRAFITAKYEGLRYVKTLDNDRDQTLLAIKRAIETNSICDLLQSCSEAKVHHYLDPASPVPFGHR